MGLFELGLCNHQLRHPEARLLEGGSMGRTALTTLKSGRRRTRCRSLESHLNYRLCACSEVQMIAGNEQEQAEKKKKKPRPRTRRSYSLFLLQSILSPAWFACKMKGPKRGTWASGPLLTRCIARYPKGITAQVPWVLWSMLQGTLEGQCPGTGFIAFPRNADLLPVQEKARGAGQQAGNCSD
jgi:hypothetical protein